MKMQWANKYLQMNFILFLHLRVQLFINTDNLQISSAVQTVF